MTTIQAPFGEMITAMVTPMAPDGTVDYDGVARLADYLVTDMRNDGLVINGTTGEAPTTTDAEQEQLLRVVLDAVGARAKVVAGVGTNDTAHTIELARRAEQAGAHGLLVVTPYYNKPPQPALEAHFTAVADATGLPMLIYDIPGRTGAAVATETLIKLAAHPRIIGVKDAKDAPGATSHVLAQTDLIYYCGTDMLHEMIDAFGAGDVARARQLHYELIPVYDGLFRNQGAVMTKAALDLLGLPGGAVRGPLLAATEAERYQLALDLTAGGVKLPVAEQPATALSGTRA